MVKNQEPKLYLTAQMPVYTSWLILMEYVSGLTDEQLRQAQLAPVLDALESPPNIGSGPYQTLYRFYWERGLKQRAASFRQSARQRQLGYDIEQFFRQIEGGS